VLQLLLSTFLLTFAPSTVHNWTPFFNDDAPAKNGISAGTHDCGNTAYVGKGKPDTLVFPGRIEISPKPGFNVVYRKSMQTMATGGFYLADNPNYTYYWVTSSGIIPDNAVRVRTENSSISFPIARVKINGRMQIGSYLEPSVKFINEDGTSDAYYNNFEVLTCDPWPRYVCKQEWKKFNESDASGPTADGFSIDSSSFIGRGTRKCINGCDFELGRIQVTAPAGAYYLDDLNASAVFDNKTAEYLIKNPSDTYKWQSSRSGEKVANALEVHKEGHKPFYIGTTRINDVIYVGKVRPGEGLFFIDANGKQKTTGSYDVLTCFSPDAANGVYEEKEDSYWFSEFGCPPRKSWNFKKWRCECKNEFKRTIPAASNAVWNEETCSYISA
jgi:hypothetical protein